MKRTITRIIAMLYLYSTEINNTSKLNEILTMLGDEEFEIDQEFLETIINGVKDNVDELDHIISRYLKKYTIERLNLVDKNLIRMGVYEIKYLKTPAPIVINEIIEISKEYSEIEGFEASKFNNSLLHAIATGLNNGK